MDGVEYILPDFSIASIILLSVIQTRVKIKPKIIISHDFPVAKIQGMGANSDA